MALLRYVKTLDQVKAAKDADPEFLDSRVRSVRCVYETDPAIAAALLPRPLEPAPRPEICVTFSHVAMQITPDFEMEIGSVVFGLKARYDGEEGISLITMPMTTEQAVIGGRETYGEPKKIADIEFNREGDRVTSKVSRMGVPYLEVAGRLGRELGFCTKVFPSCEPDRAFDSEPLLVRLEWRHDQSGVWEVEDPELVLREFPLDPVADVPVRRLVRCEYEEGTTQSNGRVLRSLPDEWVLPFLHQRYDDTSGQGIEIDL
jgi:acetoacetate decarboxylase